MKLNFRSAVASDTNALLVLLLDTIKSTCIRDYNQEQIKAWSLSARKPAHWGSMVNDQFSVVAEADSQIIGFGSLQDDCYIYFLYVHKDYLGLGIASEIYDRLAKVSCEAGQRELTANVSKTALPFFQRKGFKVVRKNKNIINDVMVINYHMVKQSLCPHIGEVTGIRSNKPAPYTSVKPRCGM